MTTTLHPYPAYKPSGVEWLGDVPAHWEVLPLGACLRERNETNDDGRVTEVLSVLRDRGVIPYSEKGNIGNKKSEDITRYKIVRPNDIVVNSMNVIIGSVGMSLYTGCLSPVYYVLTRRSEMDENSYLNALFALRPFQQSLVRLGKGILAHRMRIPIELLKREPFLRPPLAEQRTIVRYLDHADDRIRRYISAKERLITLLEEQKQAIIHQAVTRGLDPHVPLKPSGVEWLGDVPAHWEVRRVGHLSKVGNGSTPSRGNAAYWSNGTHPWLNSSSVNQGTITRADQFVTDMALRECHLPRVRSGSVLMGIIGQGRTRGMAAVLSIDATISQNIAYITPTTARVSASYLHKCLIAAYSELRAIGGASGSTEAALTCQHIKRFRVALPPRDEQAAIAHYLDEATASIDTAITRTRRQIELLREYRTRLIADVVTGKLDVREAAAHLPDELEGERAVLDGDT